MTRALRSSIAVPKAPPAPDNSEYPLPHFFEGRDSSGWLETQSYTALTAA